MRLIVIEFERTDNTLEAIDPKAMINDLPYSIVAKKVYVAFPYSCRSQKED